MTFLTPFSVASLKSAPFSMLFYALILLNIRWRNQRIIMIKFFCIPILSLHKVYLHEQYGKESTHKEIYRT